MGIRFEGMTILLRLVQVFFYALSERIKCDTCRPENETCGESVSGYFAGVEIFFLIVNLIFFDFGDSGVGNDIDVIVGEFTFCVVGDFLVVRIEDVGLTLHDMNRDLFS